MECAAIYSWRISLKPESVITVPLKNGKHHLYESRNTISYHNWTTLPKSKPRLPVFHGLGGFMIKKFLTLYSIVFLYRRSPYKLFKITLFKLKNKIIIM